MGMTNKQCGAPIVQVTTPEDNVMRAEEMVVLAKVELLHDVPRVLVPPRHLPYVSLREQSAAHGRGYANAITPLTLY